MAESKYTFTLEPSQLDSFYVPATTSGGAHDGSPEGAADREAGPAVTTEPRRDESRGLVAVRAGAETWAEPPRVSLDVSDGMDGPSGGGGEARRLHQIMRGRYLLAIGLAAALGTAGGYLGFHNGKTVYASSGQIRVKPYIPHILHQNDENGQLPALESFVEAQVALLKSQRVTDLAMQDPAWASLGRGRSDQAMSAYMKAVTVTRDGDLIEVQAVDPDPSAAVTEVRTLVTAYQKIYNEEDAQSGERRLDVLQALQTNRNNELATLRQRILDVAKVYGSDDLKGQYNFKRDQVDKLEATIGERQMQLTAATKAGAGVTGDLPADPTPEQWARYSPQMARLLQERGAYQDKIDQIIATGGGSANPDVQLNQKLVELQQRRIADVCGQLKMARAGGWSPTLAVAGGAAASAAEPGGVDVNHLREDIELLQKMRDKAQAEMIAVGKQELEIQELQAKADQARQERDEAQQRIQNLNLESTVSGRIQVISDGDRPLGAYKDTHVTYAAAGGGGGALLGFGLIAGLGLLDRRLRSPDEAESIANDHGNGGPVVLGLLPRLPAKLSDPAEAATAAHCVHEIRTSLQLWGRHAKHRVYAITSPGPGAGKTSLTLALGVSFATAKLRTLVVDCDLVGCGLTVRMDQVVNQRLGQVLLELGRVSDAQLARALDRSQRAGRRLGDTLVEMGLVTPDDLAEAVAAQGQRQVGIIDALQGTPVSLCTAETGIPNLHLLSAGAATGRDVPLLSSQAMQDLVMEVRQSFDVVLIDTGPILGSLEAQLVSALADGVIVTVTKGAPRPLVRRAMAQLATVGGRVAGVVFNRASVSDVTIYSSSVGRSVSRAPAGRLPLPPADAGRAANFGPLAVAVAQSAPVNRPA